MSHEPTPRDSNGPMYQSRWFSMRPNPKPSRKHPHDSGPGWRMEHKPGKEQQ